MQSPFALGVRSHFPADQLERGIVIPNLKSVDVSYVFKQARVNKSQNFLSHVRVGIYQILSRATSEVSESTHAYT